MSPIKAFVIDTSYLAELFFIPGKSNELSQGIIKRKFTNAIQNEHRLFVPFPVIFELGNHIAHITNGQVRADKANKLITSIHSSIMDESPWIITGSSEPDILLNFDSFFGICTEFCTRYAAESIGIVDSIIIKEAERIKGKYASFLNSTYSVHIWTRDRLVKSYEPDIEPNPYI